MSYPTFSPLTGTQWPELLTDPDLFYLEHGPGRVYPVAHLTLSQASLMCWLTQVMSVRAHGTYEPTANGTPADNPDAFTLHEIEWSFDETDFFSDLTPSSPGDEFTKLPNEFSFDGVLTKLYPCGTISGFEVGGSPDPVIANLIASITIRWTYHLPRERYTVAPLTTTPNYWAMIRFTLSASVAIEEGYDVNEDNDLINPEGYRYSTEYTPDDPGNDVFSSVPVYVPTSVGSYLPLGSDPDLSTPNLSAPLNRSVGTSPTGVNLLFFDKLYFAPVVTHGARSL